MADKSKSKSSDSKRSASAKPKGATVTAGPNVGSSSDEEVSVPRDVAEAGIAEKFPSTAPTPVEEAMEQEKDAREEQGKLTNSKRIERLEMALTSGLNIDLNQYKVP